MTVKRIRLVYELADGTSMREAHDCSGAEQDQPQLRTNAIRALTDQLEFRLRAKIKRRTDGVFEITTPTGTILLTEDLLARASDGTLQEAIAMVVEWKRRGLGSPT